MPINIVMVSKPGLYSSEHIIDFGVASRNGLVTSKALNLCNSAKSSIIVQVFNMRRSNANTVSLGPQYCKKKKSI